MLRAAGAGLVVSVGLFATVAAAGELPTPTPTVCTEIPPPKLSFQFSVDPQQPMVGDDVQLSFTVSGSGGIPQYTLSGAAPVFQGDTSPMHSNVLGTVTYSLTAAQAGTAMLTLNVNYETAFGCVEQPIFQFVSETSPPFMVEVVEPTPTMPPGETGCCQVPGQCFPNVTRAQCEPFGGEFLPGIAVCDILTRGCVLITPTPTPTAPPLPCIGDCNSDGSVDVAELITGVNIALGLVPFTACPAFDCTSDCHPGPIAITPTPQVDVACLIRAVNNALDGCPPMPCTSDADCDDGNGCSVDRCTTSGCVHECVCD
jgi:hypothetical protein